MPRGYISPNSALGFEKFRRRYFRDLARHGKLTSRSKHELRHRMLLAWLKKEGMRA